MHRHLTRLTTLLAALGLDVACWHGLAADRAALTRPAHLPADLTAWLTAVAAWLLSLALTWLVLLVALTVLEPYAGRELATYAGCPAWLRPTLLALCGVGVIGALAGPAQGTPAAGHGGDPAGPVQRVGVVDGLPVPDLPVDRPARRTQLEARTVVVAPGDSLWHIAERALSGRPSDAVVDSAWRRLYERNRARIGDDPDQIRPGLRLSLATTPQEER